MNDIETKVNILWELFFGKGKAQRAVITPQPVKWCRNKVTGGMERIQSLSAMELYKKVLEEDAEAEEAFCGYLGMIGGNPPTSKEEWAMEVMDSIFARYTLLKSEGIDTEELVRKVYEKNKARGYYDED